MARKQSSTIYYKGNTHKEIYYQGHYHDKMYKGSQLVWEKLNSEYEQDKYINVADYSIYAGETYLICYLYDTSNNQTTYMGVYIGKFNKEKICVDLLYKIKEIDGYNRYLIHACKDGIVLIKYDYKYSETNTENKCIMQIADFSITNAKFKTVGKGSFTEDTTIFVPPFMQNDVYNPFQFMVFGADYYIKQNIVYDDSNYGYTNLIKYSYDNQIIKETAADDTIMTGSQAELTYRNVFGINNKYYTLYNSYFSPRMCGISYDEKLENKKKYTMESPGYARQSLKQASSGSERAAKNFLTVCGDCIYALGRLNVGRYYDKDVHSLFSFSPDKLSTDITFLDNNPLNSVVSVGGNRMIANKAGKYYCLIENGQLKSEWERTGTARLYAYDDKQIYLLFGAYLDTLDSNLSYIKTEQLKIRIIK